MQAASLSAQRCESQAVDGRTDGPSASRYASQALVDRLVTAFSRSAFLQWWTDGRADGQTDNRRRSAGRQVDGGQAGKQPVGQPTGAGRSNVYFFFSFFFLLFA